MAFSTKELSHGETVSCPTYELSGLSPADGMLLAVPADWEGAGAQLSHSGHCHSLRHSLTSIRICEEIDVITIRINE